MKNRVLERSIVLVVDDHPEMLQLLIDALEEAHVTVLVATDGTSALATAERLVPDLILLDAIMPGMDGFETCRALKNGPATEVPVIFMTGLEDTEHIVKGLEAGGIDYLTKPIVPNELLARMRVHLTNARSAQGVKAALDVSGRTLFATNAKGRVKWATPQAQVLLAKLSSSNDHGETAKTTALLQGFTLPSEIHFWISRCAESSATVPNESMTYAATALKMRLSMLSRVNEDEILFVIQQADPQEIQRQAIDKLQQCFGLTLREAEVLYWLSLGKSNRDIAEILGMSYRTADKHLEHIYPKVGVESRSAASAASVRILEE
jgi:DNA-binding response OmpR family regulator/DNA-binding CsgD family transcriptional regulator